MFDISTLATNGETSSAILIFFSVLMAFCLSALLVFTFEKTSREVVRPDHFLQSMILMSIVTATILQCVGDSVARGFGIFGALAILRLRLDVGSARSVAFLFAAMAVGVGCGVFSFLTASIGTLFFCVAVFLLYKSPFSKAQNLRGRLRIDMAPDSPNVAVLQTLIGKFCHRAILKDCQMLFLEEKKDMVSYEYQIKLKDDQQGLLFATEINKLSDAKNVRLSFKDANERDEN